MKDVNICAAVNNDYVPYLAVMLESLIMFADKDRTYKIHVLHTDIDESNQRLICQMMTKNFEVQFYDVNERMKGYSNLFVSNHIKIETYFRLLLPDMLRDVDKILYIDCDVIANTDVAKLYDVDVTNYFLAGTRDADIAANYNKDISFKDYMDSVVGIDLDHPYDYIQAGIILMNLRKFREECNTDSLLNIALSREWMYHDQDTLNHVCVGNILFVDYAWDFVYDYNESFRRSKEVLIDAPNFILQDYLRAKAEPKMIHFSWTDKPWFSPGVHYGEKWWMIARNTPYYSKLLLDTEKKLAEYIIGAK